mmetsp:Transcript_26084/g.30105  ORF Transcript_26084/g.30105 Transcript_26084/m.30105 type:complete len:140 (+) Transcript_26084:186-605(+)
MPISRKRSLKRGVDFEVDHEQLEHVNKNKKLEDKHIHDADNFRINKNKKSRNINCDKNRVIKKLQTAQHMTLSIPKSSFNTSIEIRKRVKRNAMRHLNIVRTRENFTHKGTKPEVKSSLLPPLFPNIFKNKLNRNAMKI